MKFHPEYGLMFNDLGRLVPGVKKTYLFVTIDIPTTETLADIRFKFPDCAEMGCSKFETLAKYGDKPTADQRTGTPAHMQRDNRGI